MAGKKPEGGGMGRGSSGMPTGGTGKAKSNVTKIGSKKTMGKTEIKVRAKTDKVRRSPAAEDMRKGNLDNLKKTFGKQKVTKKNNSPFGPIAAGIVKPKATPKLNAKAKAAIGATAATANAVRINKNKKKSEPVPRNPRKQ